MEEESEHLVATPEQWAYFEQVHSAFGLTLPTNVKALAAIGSAIYLVGQIGANFKLRANNEVVYNIIRKLLSPLEQEFIEALWLNKKKHIQELGASLDVLGKQPADFV